MWNKEKKTSIVEGYRVHEKDTGSPEVEVALLSERITQLTSHLQANPKDQHSRRGLLKLVGRRRRRLVYLNGKSVKRYRTLIGKLGLRK